MFEEVSRHDRRPFLWKFAVFCGLNDVRHALADTNTALLFFDECIDLASATEEDNENGKNSQRQCFQAASAAGYRLLKSDLGRAEDFQQACMKRLGTALEASITERTDTLSRLAMLSCACLKAVISSPCSYRTCVLAIETVLPCLCEILHTFWHEQSHTMASQIDRPLTLGDLVSTGIPFIVSDSHEEQATTMCDIREGSDVWQTPIQRQRAFTLCLKTLLSRLEAKRTFEGSLLAFGSLISGAGDGE